MKVWISLKIKQKIVRDVVIEVDENTPLSEQLLEMLTPICLKWDVGRPIIMRHHLDEVEEFGRVVFKKDHFIETFDYDTLEIEAIIERKEQDPDLYI